MDDATLELIKHAMGPDFAKQLLIWTTSLAVASWIHSGRVKKAITDMTLSVNAVLEKLTVSLEVHSKEMVAIKMRQVQIDGQNERQDERLSAIESTLKEMKTMIQTEIMIHGGGSPST